MCRYTTIKRRYFSKSQHRWQVSSRGLWLRGAESPQEETLVASPICFMLDDRRWAGQALVISTCVLWPLPSCARSFLATASSLSIDSRHSCLVLGGLCVPLRCRLLQRPRQTCGAAPSLPSPTAMSERLFFSFPSRS
jgi:hypothetical protein